MTASTIYITHLSNKPHHALGSVSMGDPIAVGGDSTEIGWDGRDAIYQYRNWRRSLPGDHLP